MYPTHVRPEWRLALPEPEWVLRLVKALGIHPLLAQCLVNRGMIEPEAAERFLEPRLKDLSDPFELKGMREAVQRLWIALENQEDILIFGDYDVDGVSSSSILNTFLSEMGWKVNCFLPNRFSEGYGLTSEAVNNCFARGAFSLLLAVDCGTTATETVQCLKEKGIDVIILDHHLPSNRLPDAVALVNPKAYDPQTPGPGASLCTAGLAFKMIHGLVKHGRTLAMEAFEKCDIRSYLDLVALGTIADLVPLHEENRILVHAGLKCLSKTTRPGLIALKKVSGLSGDLDTAAAAFQLGPRLNAAGRLEDATQSFSLLISESVLDSDAMARSLDQHNRDRQRVEAAIVTEVEDRLLRTFSPDRDWCIVEANTEWHPGVVGIIAARIMRKFHRPTFILGGDTDGLKGSGRSIEGFDMAHALDQLDSILVSHGGHAMAAGVTLSEKNLDAFRTGMNEQVKQHFGSVQPQPILKLDAELACTDLNLEVMRYLEMLAPFGQANPRVKLQISSVFIGGNLRKFGKTENHLTMQIELNDLLFQIIWWNYQPDRIPSGWCDLAVEVGLETFRGVEKLRLYLLDWRPSQKREETK